MLHKILLKITLSVIYELYADISIHSDYLFVNELAQSHKLLRVIDALKKMFYL